MPRDYRPSPAQMVRAKTPLPVALDSESWARVHAGIKRQAFFMAAVDDLRLCQVFREVTARMMEGKLSKVEARQLLNHALAKLNYEPGDDFGTIKDLGTTKRQNLVLETNARMAASMAQRISMRGNIARPAKRLVREGTRRQERNWESRWRTAYAAVGGEGACAGQMVALNESPIWAALSHKKTNALPLDFNSGMGWAYITLAEAKQLGLINEEVIADIKRQGREPAEFDAPLKAHLQKLDPDLKRAAEKLFGSGASLQDDTLTWDPKKKAPL